MILSLIGALGGGVMRILPEIMAFFNKKTDNAHELALLDRQVALEQTKAAGQLELAKQVGVDALAQIGANADREAAGYSAADSLALLDAQKAAMQSQMQRTGITWVDALNFLVRPLTTYYMLLLYGIAKVAIFMVVWHSGQNMWGAVLKVYDDEDRAMLSGILAFWYTGRVFDKKA